MTDTEMSGGVALAEQSQQPANETHSGAMDVESPPKAAASITDSTLTSRRPVTVDKPNPYTFDLGNLLCNDPNPVPRNPDDLEETLAANARDAAQVLINQVLSTCEIKSAADGVHIVLPQPTTPLPREKPIPADKEPTKWELFAKKKGIDKKKRDNGKMVYDDASGEWVPKWGYKGKNKEGDDEWLVEVDEKKEKATGEAHDARAEGRRERKERVRRNERKQRANERKATKSG
ncbi:RRS1-domain-containing protein [Lentithecium fluviatile CBS 122367]|uniref:Ribosome biogenesis regulatory protein n=1 Tax=Lentithecium fluviatile CBS 122367 TaxID=1168545 RepID=A0A6G1J3L7_9PLEO|nr:RRS1-domain-containing protein [Lentithecium fluviatile CBS 122367]